MTRKRNKIILTDDAVEMAKILKELFEVAGYQVEQACDGIQALEKIKKGFEPDLIILDMDMPRMGGIAFYHEIVNKVDGTPKYPVLVFTGRANMETVFKDLKVEGFMTKPFEMDVLQKKIDEIFDRLYGDNSEKPEAPQKRERNNKIIVIDEDRDSFDRIVVAFTNADFRVFAGLGPAEKIKEGTDRTVAAMIRAEKAGAVLMKINSMNPLSAEFSLARAVLERTRESDIPFILYGGRSFIPYDAITGEMTGVSGLGALVPSSDPDELLRKTEFLLHA